MAIKIDEDHEHRQAKRKRSLRIDPKRLRLLRLLMEDRNMNAMNIANVQEQSIKQKLFCQRHYMDKIWPRCVKCDLK
ncbi:hypothetical protein QR98_0072530 [Sarcoptes scabiei]|uniref:Uncharacterized protein n=1 Tax=Sarcoptes scabiei TaxID=52283 RepID=A0A132ACY1_SARSC|nr:hypothetical protein QR98_0072530 [Sarcoptes scabiei]